ncbi:acyl-coenzyme A synthetase ACSM1, mitochondrial isoform X2 [Pipistrellus kuhlii]|uniref:acyl-coenzyme A synthetase ACSM1, mitochondrial isoform X2 n=1 Tax=Pipistrellus kuhlii TaxID=59472 RepID=UPI001E272D45|nr:acyl-coenzyme A synthetase ACSM1, mitochondrial isoform X2 [Pipistrellus kuhlii]
MQWLMRLRVLWGTHKSCHAFQPASWHLRSQSVTATGAPRWNDHDTPEKFNFASDVVDYWTQMEKEGKRGPNPALWWVNSQGDEVKWSFRELTDFTCRAANVFTQTCGLQQGDRLALILPRVPEWWLVTMGCMRTGIVFMPGTTQMKAKDILYRLKESNAKSIVTTDALAPDVDSVASQCPALKTKLLVSDHSREGWLDFRSLINRKLLKLKASDVLWCISDPGWITAAAGTLFEPWTAGSTVFTHHLPQFDPKVIVETFFKYPITQCLTAPSVFRMILQQNFSSLRFPTLEHCTTGGEALLPEEQEKWREQTGLLLHQIYGQSETGITCGTARGSQVKTGSMGKAIPPFDVQVIDDKGNILPPNTEGNLGIRMKPTKPIGLFMLYENDPVKTAKVECGDFYNTGDKATIDEEGYIWFLGRDDDIINASGYRIGPAEVENALAEHPAVAESAVVSSPDPIRGQVVKAFVVLTPQFLSHDPDQLIKELQEHVKSVTAPYKYPRKVEFVPELPKTVTGKIKRSELREKEFGQKQPQ